VNDTKSEEILYRISWKITREYRNSLDDEFDFVNIDENSYRTLFDSVAEAFQYFYTLHGISNYLRYQHGPEDHFFITFYDNDPVDDVDCANRVVYYEIYVKSYLLKEL